VCTTFAFAALSANMPPTFGFHLTRRYVITKIFMIEIILLLVVAFIVLYIILRPIFYWYYRLIQEDIKLLTVYLHEHPNESNEKGDGFRLTTMEQYKLALLYISVGILIYAFLQDAMWLLWPTMAAVLLYSSLVSFLTNRTSINLTVFHKQIQPIRYWIIIIIYTIGGLFCLLVTMATLLN